MKRGGPAFAIVLAACGPTVSGEVRDATSDRPVADAVVEVTTSGWGMRDGGLVWDKDYSYRAQTGGDGKFRVKGVDGGHRLTVRSPGYPPLQTSLCSRSPMIVYVGGPFDGGDFGKNLSIGTTATGERVGWRFGGKGAQVPEADAELIALRPGSTDNVMIPLRAPFGMAFRPGTGNPPKEPATGFATERTLDLLRDCGWLFVRTRDAGTVPVRIGSFGLDEPIGGGRYLMLTYVAAPARR